MHAIFFLFRATTLRTQRHLNLPNCELIVEEKSSSIRESTGSHFAQSLTSNRYSCYTNIAIHMIHIFTHNSSIVAHKYVKRFQFSHLQNYYSGMKDRVHYCTCIIQVFINFFAHLVVYSNFVTFYVFKPHYYTHEVRRLHQRRLIFFFSPFLMLQLQPYHSINQKSQRLICNIKIFYKLYS